MYDSLNRAWGIGLLPSRMCSSEAWESAASNLWVEWVAKTVGPVWSLGSPCIAWRSRYIGLKRAYAYQASSK